MSAQRASLESRSGEPPAASVRLGMLLTMARARGLESRAYDLFMEGLIAGTTHLAIGQEAVAAGFGAAMRETDWTFCTYRGHHHAVARNVPLGPILAEVMHRSGGLMRGKGGSMHITSVTHGLMGSYAIVGAHLPIAVGAAWSAQVRGTQQVAVCFFGDGATNIGAFHEALNLASVWRLPVVFVCENNGYMEYTPIRSVTSVDRPAADRASAYGLEAIAIDGNDPDAVYRAAVDAISAAREGRGPSLIEALTYRFFGHSRADPGKYRPDDEVAEWRQRDPLTTYPVRLLAEGVPQGEIDVVLRQAADEVAKATEWAKASPMPAADEATTDLWADGGSAWRN